MSKTSALRPKKTNKKAKKKATGKPIKKQQAPRKRPEPLEIEDYEQDEEIEEISEHQVDEEEDEPALDPRTGARLKAKITEWMDADDRIKELDKRVKKYKETRKKHEELIISMISKLKVEEMRFDIHDNDNKFRGRVYRHKSVTKEALKEAIIKDALMEAIRDEKKVNQLLQKIEDKRPLKERFYLKRTKGNSANDTATPAKNTNKREKKSDN